MLGMVELAAGSDESRPKSLRRAADGFDDDLTILNDGFHHVSALFLYEFCAKCY